MIRNGSAPLSGERITLHNLLHRGHRYQAAMDAVFQRALGGLPGTWDVSAYPFGRAWFRIDVVAPDGAKWSLSVPVHEGPGPDELADTIRAACLRHSRLKPKGGTRGAGKPAVSPAAAPDGAHK